MSVGEKFKRISLMKKVMLIAALPLFFFFIFSVKQILENLSSIESATQTEENIKVLGQASSLIGVLQVERGKSAVYLKSDGGLEIDGVMEQRALVDVELEKLKDLLAQEHLISLGNADFFKSLGTVETLRKIVSSNGDVSSAVSGYTKIILSLKKLQDRTIEAAPTDIARMINGVLLLETARENAGLLRANLSGILAADNPIDSATLSKLLQFKAGIDGNLSSPSLVLSEKSMKEIRTIQSRPHWQKVTRVFKKVILASAEGDYGHSGPDFFKTATKLVNDISSIIGRELPGLTTLTQEYKESATQSVIINIFINALVIFLTTIFVWATVRSIRANLTNLIDQMHGTSDKIFDSSGALLQSSNHLASGSQQTAAAIQETVSSMAEMNSMVSRCLEKSKGAKESSVQVGQKVSDGNSIVEKMVESMQSIKESNEDLQEINKIIGSIAKQTKVINDIVFKTQLLAVNASIESAKAGIHGKGFAVVADEVSKLAHLSGESSSRISGLLEESDEKVTAIVSGVSQRVERGMQTTVEVKSIFEEISSNVNDIIERSEDMMQASEEQNLGIEQVTAAISEIDEATQSNTMEAQSVDNQANNLKKQNEELQTVSNDLAVMSFGTKYRSEKATSDSENDPNPPSEGATIVSLEEPAPQNLLVAEDDGDSLADDDSFKPAASA